MENRHVKQEMHDLQRLHSKFKVRSHGMNGTAAGSSQCPNGVLFVPYSAAAASGHVGTERVGREVHQLLRRVLDIQVEESLPLVWSEWRLIGSEPVQCPSPLPLVAIHGRLTAIPPIPLAAALAPCVRACSALAVIFCMQCTSHKVFPHSAPLRSADGSHCARGALAMSGRVWAPQVRIPVMDYHDEVSVCDHCEIIIQNNRLCAPLPPAYPRAPLACLADALNNRDQLCGRAHCR